MSLVFTTQVHSENRQHEPKISSSQMAQVSPTYSVWTFTKKREKRSNKWGPPQFAGELLVSLRVYKDCGPMLND
ncbi:MAG: hypothetical protein LBO05_10855, partial [Deltaproteobacteria bacterium]|nr:hypothetical protein [Deltaproteobacteria bacterium]